jgi:hypothetical protein
MSRRADLPQPRRLRRFGAIAALIGLVFASTVASVSHSVAMPMMAGPALQATGQAPSATHQAQGEADRPGAASTGHHMAQATHDCADDATTDTPQQKPQGPCENGCQQCKDCTVTAFMLISPIGIDAGERYGRYEPAAARALASITPLSPNEPPRV